MTFDGADTAALTTLAGQMGRAADDLDHVGASMGSTLGSTQWTGADAARFRSAWDSDSARALRAASSALRDAGHRLVAEARQQDQASAADGGSSSGAVTGGGGAFIGGAANGLIDAFDKAVPGGLANLGSLGLSASAMGLDKAFDLVTKDLNISAGLSAATSAWHLGEAAGALASGDYMGALDSGLHSAADGLKAAPNPTLNLAGSALGIWTFVGEEAVKADFPNTWGPTMDYIRTNPMDALGGAFDGINNSWTSIAGAVL
ncbi:hypothetical protein [uncultured Williamsia sp.]|uniref:hypothetical protein n=1 Tax=uncultured Williamsia sp. TaxID=259311 RepID=UPI00261CFB18|nr:hypothetical protein [uncultured Williamsia sp.]